MDGRTYSNTRVLNKCYGWSGLLVEANIENYSKMIRRLDRDNVTVKHSAVCEPPERWTSFTIDGDAVSVDTRRTSKRFLKRWAHVNHPSKTVMVPCTTMDELLGDMRVVDFFSLDVEGAEYTVLKTMNFSKTNVVTFCIEMDGHDPVKNANVVALLHSQGFKRCNVNDRRNGWFRKDC